MTYDNFLASLTQATPPPFMPPLQALWLCKNDQCEAAHNIAQDLRKNSQTNNRDLLSMLGSTAKMVVFGRG